MICWISVSSNNFYIYIFFTYIEISKDSSLKYYKNNKHRIQMKACKTQQSLTKEEREKKGQYGRGQYKNLSEDEKEKVVKNRKKASNEKQRLIVFIQNYNLKKL